MGEEAEKKAIEAESKRKRLEEAEKKRQAMMAAQKEKQQAAESSQSGGRKDPIGANIQEARREMTKTKEQLEEEKKISLSIRIKPIDVDSLDSDGLRQKASDLWDTIIRLETEKYDIEEKQKRQNYDLKELKERQKQQLRQKAMKKGLDLEALTGKYPPKIRMYSKYERRTDTRTYEDRKTLYEGGWTVLYSEVLEKDWKEKHDDWDKRSKAKLPKWFGERPGKKGLDPESPDDDGEGAVADIGVEEDEDEEVPEEEEEEEELKRLEEKQAKRKEVRAEQEKKLAQQKKEEEERLRKEEAEKKAKEAEEKKKRLEEAEMKRQAMMQAQKEKRQAAGKGGGAKASAGAGVQDARKEMKNQRAIGGREKDLPFHQNQTPRCR